jgi:hypothetical protein
MELRLDFDIYLVDLIILDFEDLKDLSILF